MDYNWNRETEFASSDLLATSVAINYVDDGGRDLSELERLLWNYYHEWVFYGSEKWSDFARIAVNAAFDRIDFLEIAKDLMESAIEICKEESLADSTCFSDNKRPVQKRRAAAKKNPATRRR